MSQPLDLGAAARLAQPPSTIQITDIRVLMPASLTFTAGGCDQRGCVIKAEIADIPRDRLFLLPLTLQGAIQAYSTLGQIIAEHTNTKSKG